MTDLLGVCVAWSVDSCVVQPESGPPVTIPLNLIVSGKPVPPRPSVRLRVSSRDAELHVASLFSGITVEQLGEWLLRHDPAPVGRPRKRANSCLAMGDPGRPFDEAVATVRDFYSARSAGPLVQVELGSEIGSAFAAAGWATLDDGDAHFQLASVARVRRQLVAGTAELTVSGATATARLVAEDFDGDSGGDLGGHLGGGIIASGQATLDGDWLGLHDVLVDPAHRRRGLARDVLATLLAWGAEQGAGTAWLHVEVDNEAALALYGSLGFVTHHTSRYLRG